MPIKNILVVDDSPTDRQFLSELLAKNGYKVVTAQSAEEAFAKVKQQRPDLVLMDVVMPGQNGFQATRALTKDDSTKGIPVIICTSKGQETDKVWGMRQGARDYIVKPVNQADLLAKQLVGGVDLALQSTPWREAQASRPASALEEAQQDARALADRLPARQAEAPVPDREAAEEEGDAQGEEPGVGRHHLRFELRPADVGMGEEMPGGHQGEDRHRRLERPDRPAAAVGAGFRRSGHGEGRLGLGEKAEEG